MVNSVSSGSFFFRLDEVLASGLRGCLEWIERGQKVITEEKIDLRTGEGRRSSEGLKSHRTKDEGNLALAERGGPSRPDNDVSLPDGGSSSVVLLRGKDT